MDNFIAVLRMAGMDLSRVVQVRSYVDDPDDLAQYNRIYREYLKTPYPARTTLLRRLGGVLKFEIDAMAVAPT